MSCLVSILLPLYNESVEYATINKYFPKKRI